MELEYKLADLIGKAQTDEQWRNALNAYGDTAWALNEEVKERLTQLLTEASKRITKQNNEFYDLCFDIRKEHGFHNAIAKSNALPVVESCGSIPPLENLDLTADNVAKVAETLTRKVA